MLSQLDETELIIVAIPSLEVEAHIAIKERDSSILAKNREFIIIDLDEPQDLIAD